MLTLISPSDVLQLVTTATAAQQATVHVSYVDWNGSYPIPGRQNTSVSSATTTTIVDAPGSGIQRNIKFINIFFLGSSGFLTVQHFNGTTTVTLFRLTCDRELYQSIVYSEARGWQSTLFGDKLVVARDVP
jgi:hypothetical protein